MTKKNSNLNPSIKNSFISVTRTMPNKPFEAQPSSLSFLTSLGLTTKELLIYELLLNHGESNTPPLIQKSGLKKPTVYKLLHQLEDKGLVKSTPRNHTTYFKPTPPSKLLEITEQQLNTLHRTKNTLDSIFSQLNSTYLLSVEKPIISTFEGVSGIKKVYLDTLKEAQSIYALLQADQIHPELTEWIRNTYAPQRAKLGIQAYVIISTGNWTSTFVKQSSKKLRTVRVVPQYKFPFKHEINIYADKIAILQYNFNDQPLGIIIQHPFIFQTMKAWFDLAWERADEYNHKYQTK